MSRQRSSTPGRGSQAVGTRATSSNKTTQEQDVVGPASIPPSSGDFMTSGEQRTATTEQSTMEKAQQLAGQVQEKATQRVESGLARGKSQAANTLNTVAESLISTAQQLRERNQEPVSRYVDQVADRVQRVSNYLQSTDVSEIVDRTEEFARRRPALFLGGAFALGLLGARFLKSSNRSAQGVGRGSGGRGPRHIREGITGIEVEVPTSQQEWAAGGVGAPGFADVAGPAAPSPSLRDSGLGRNRDQLDFGAVAGGPEAAQR